MSARSELLEKLEAESLASWPEPWWPQDRRAAGLASVPASVPLRVCRNGHEITEWQDRADGKRGCLICKQIATARRAQRKAMTGAA